VLKGDMDNTASGRSRFLNALQLLAYMAVIFLLSVRPVPESVPGFWQMDKLVHAVVYGVMGILALPTISWPGTQGYSVPPHSLRAV